MPNPFEKGLERYLSTNDLIKIQSVRIGIAGAGGLGSNCAANLVRSGFRSFTLVDNDQVDFSNLNRQFFFMKQAGKPKAEMLKQNLLDINPDLDIRTLCRKIDAGNVKSLFMDCDIIIEAVDTPWCKALIVETWINSSKLLVAASGIGGVGKSDEIRIRKIRDNFFIVGDAVSEVSETCPPLAPRVTIAAAKQSDIVLSWTMGRKIL